MSPRFHACGEGALLMDVAEGAFDLQAQQHLWAMTAADAPLRAAAGVRALVLGVNNLLVMFDARRVRPAALREQMQDAWIRSAPAAGTGRLLEVPVHYDRAAGSELEAIARQVKLEVEDVIRLHTSVEYHVACIGSVPGFPYLVGMPARLAVPRQPTPRARLAKGSVAIGGTQAGIIPMDMPSGWNVLGRTELELFDPTRPEPCLLAPGDRLRFVDVEARG